MKRRSCITRACLLLAVSFPPVRGRTPAFAEGTMLTAGSEFTPLSGKISLVMEGAVFQDRILDGEAYAGPAVSLYLETVYEDGHWAKVLGSAPSFNRGHHRGRVLESEVSNDGVHMVIEMSINADPWVPGGRVVYEVELDRTGGGKKVWQWQLPKLDDKSVSVKISGRTFSISRGDASLSETFVAPADVKLEIAKGERDIHLKDGKSEKVNLNAVHATTRDDFFVVRTLQRGESPEVNVEGTGLSAKATVSAQTVSFDGEKVLFGEQ